jgi:hypothetical protein
MVWKIRTEENKNNFWKIAIKKEKNSLFTSSKLIMLKKKNRKQSSDNIYKNLYGLHE